LKILEIWVKDLLSLVKRQMLVNGISRRLIDFAGNLKIVFFSPWDMELVTESPSLRRRFLDTVLSQTDREYRRAIASYEKGLRQRNRLLLRIREENLPAGRQGVSRSHLLFWDQLLIKNGDYIGKQRNSFIEFVNSVEDLPITDYSLEYDRSAISEGRLAQYKNEEVAAATTLVGPHRDDFIFKIHQSSITNHQSLAAYGSRGEQRMGVLWLKMAELLYIQRESGEMPVLLLDDIFSELDEKHREIVFEIIKDKQTVITTADEHFLKNFEKKDIKIIKL